MSDKKTLTQLVVQVTPSNNRKAAETLGERLDAIEVEVGLADAPQPKKKKSADAAR